MKISNFEKSIYLFIVFAFGIPLICVLLVKNLTVFQSGLSSFILLGIEATSPTFSALIVTMILTGNAGISTFFKKCYIDNIKIKYLILSLIIPFSVLFVTKLALLIFIDSSPAIAEISIKKLTIIMSALIAEELGWRGFLQEKLDKRFGCLVTPILVGVIWALWHYHFFWLGTMSAPLILFFLSCIADSFGYYWVTKKSNGNVIPASIWHFTGNLFFNLFLLSPEHNQGSILPYLIFVVCSSIMAVGITIWGTHSNKKPSLL